MKKASAAFIAFIWRVLKGKTSHCCYVVAELHCPWHSAKAVSQLWILVPSCFLHEIGVSCLYFKGKDPSLWKQFECCMPQLTLLLVFVVLSRAGLWIAQTLYLGTSEPKKERRPHGFIQLETGLIFPGTFHVVPGQFTAVLEQIRCFTVVFSFYWMQGRALFSWIIPPVFLDSICGSLLQDLSFPWSTAVVLKHPFSFLY